MLNTNIDFNNLSDFQKNVILGLIQNKNERDVEEKEVEKNMGLMTGDFLTELYKVGEKIHIGKVSTRWAKERIFLYRIVLNKKDRVSTAYATFELAMLGALVHLQLGFNNDRVAYFMADGLKLDYSVNEKV